MDNTYSHYQQHFNDDESKTSNNVPILQYHYTLDLAGHVQNQYDNELCTLIAQKLKQSLEIWEDDLQIREDDLEIWEDGLLTNTDGAGVGTSGDDLEVPKNRLKHGHLTDVESKEGMSCITGRLVSHVCKKDIILRG